MSTLEPIRVVIVDDTPDLRDLLRMALERSGDFTVVGEAANGREAVEAARLHRPDLVLLDIAMPVMDGLEALPMVRQTCPESTVVMLSGFGASAMTAKALAGGAHGYIQKGQPLSALLSQLRMLVARNAPGRGSDFGSASAHGTPGRAPRALSLVGEPVEPHPADASDSDFLDHAPIGFLQLRGPTILTANREATRLLGDLVEPGLGLGSAVPALWEHLEQTPGEDSTLVLDLGDPPRRIVATVRRHGPDVLVYLHTQAGDEVELLRRAIGTAAHEIRTPVSVLMGVAETLVMHQAELSEADRLRMLDAIGRQTRLLDNITADLLAAGQAQHGSLTMQLEPVDPVDVLHSVVDGASDVTVVIEDHRLVLADSTRLQQMVSNLVSNARKYGESPITLRVQGSDEMVHIHVEDEGPGVPAEFRPRLFQEYQRAAGTSARGTGLGLFVVRALAEAQGGRVTYAPRQPKGAIFTITLPAFG